VHRARRLLRLSQVVSRQSGDSGDALRPSPVCHFLQDRAYPHTKSFLDKVIF
jgi:hypothetical protein